MKLDIKTCFYSGVTSNSDVVKINRCMDPASAVPNAIRHLQTNQYAARLCEVYSTETGVLYAVVKRHINGDINILYRNPVV